MGKDESAKKKLKRDHNKTDHPKTKSPDKPKKKTEKPSKPAKSPSKPKPQAKVSKPKSASDPAKNEENSDKLFKPGQRHPEPSLEDPTRAFYESLYEQNPSSHMAQKYCLEYGLLPEDVAVKVSETLKKKGR